MSHKQFFKRRLDLNGKPISEYELSKKIGDSEKVKTSDKDEDLEKKNYFKRLLW